MTDDTTTVAVSRSTKERLDAVADGTYNDKILSLLDRCESHRVEITVSDDDRVADLIEEYT